MCSFIIIFIKFGGRILQPSTGLWDKLTWLIFSQAQMCRNVGMVVLRNLIQISHETHVKPNTPFKLIIDKCK